ncbi:hypothetical protein [Streptacidiphilus sp. EB129]|uniref:hypothetical protein n=1 Tax=Streptacidiphilus sp. EB129 TaxID=3156262 RepID=UPI00351770E5
MHQLMFSPDTLEGASICALLARLQDEQEGTGDWNGSRTIEVLNDWFAELGLDVEEPAPSGDLRERLRLMRPGDLLPLAHDVHGDDGTYFADGTQVTWTCERCTITRTGTTVGAERESEHTAPLQLVRFDTSPLLPDGMPAAEPADAVSYPVHPWQLVRTSEVRTH